MYYLFYLLKILYLFNLSNLSYPSYLSYLLADPTVYFLIVSRETIELFFIILTILISELNF